MRHTFITILSIYAIFGFVVLSALAPFSFLNEQKRYERVKTAIDEKQEFITGELKDKGLQPGNFRMLIVAYKMESQLEIYVKKKTDAVYSKLATYDICARSGGLGPKRKAGDRQVPEGFYYIDRFNPASSYYLSLGVSYPNQSDKLKSKAADPGGDIFIHGSCVTIGCMPMTDDKIKEIYLYAVHAKNNGQSKIPVYIFPFRMTEANMKAKATAYADEPEVVTFWQNIKTGYDQFEKDKKELDLIVAKNGDYQLNK